jgi:cytochrome d ubiquinol oxidase subunit II
VITLADGIAGAVMLALNAYVVLGGADFGAGVWDLVASGPRAARQRAVIADGIGPIWEANHVWLILVIVLLFGCFPAVYASLSVTLHIPLTLMLIGVVLRGSAFTFRAYDSTGSAVQRHWGRIFAIASTITPVLLGVCVGALVSGALAVPADADFTTRFVRPWTTPFALLTGLFALALFAFLAAVYLTVEARDEDLQEDFRRHALLSGGAVGVLAGALLWIGHGIEGSITDGLLTRPFSSPLQVVTGAAAVTAIAALVRGAYRAARVAAVVQVSLIVWGWGYAQYPALVPGVHTIESSAAPPVTLRLVALGLAGGACVLVPSLWYLFKVFKSEEASAFVRVDTAEHTTAHSVAHTTERPAPPPAAP